MKNFKEHIKSLSDGKITYFITDSKLDIFHENIDNSVILSGSFNPVHPGHVKLLNYSSQMLDINKYYEISLSNVDKPDIDQADLIKRIKNFDSGEKIIISRSSKFIDKSEIYKNSYFVVGYDTAVRILDESYLSPGESLEGLFSVLRKNNCSFIVAGRVDVSGLNFDNLDIRDLVYRDFFRVISEEEFREDISSTDKRRHNL